MADHRNSAPLFLTARAAAEYLRASREELLSWVPPDRRLPGEVGLETGARLWLRLTLDAARLHVEAWRERDRAVASARAAELEAEQAAATARRKRMRKGGAVMAKTVCERLAWSLAELNRWAGDGRLPADGEIMMAGLPKTVNAPAWLPSTIDGTADFPPVVRRLIDRAATIATDELPAYLAIGRQHHQHIRVNHSAGEYARTDARTGLRAHVNTAESVHSIFKRAIVGVWHRISGKHMGRYLHEVEFRWNRRRPVEGRLATVLASKSGPLPLKALFG